MPEPSATMELQPSPAAAAAAAALDPAEHMQSCRGELASFPHLDDSDFENACSVLLAKFRQYGSGQDQWATVETLCRNEITFLRITKPLLVHAKAPNTSDNVDEVELDEEDDEVAASALPCPAVVHYDVLLSPSYRVPVLYFTIVDSQHRYPPTSETLHSFVIPPTFKSQTEHVGVIGGITTTDHPATNRPVFFIHPCQTAEVMVASVGEQNITAYDYLLIWMGALGKFVGLDVPMSLLDTSQNKDES